MKLDKIDRRILAALQENCRVSTQVLSEKVGLSPSAVQRRINRLRQGNVIAGEVAILSPEAVGRPLILIVDVTLKGEDIKTVEEFRKKMTRTPEVMQCYFVTGSTDYVLIYSAESMEMYEAFTKREFFDNPYVSTFSTKVVMKSLKFALRLPVN